MADETTVPGRSLERWTITIPRQGPQGKESIQGTPVYFFYLEDTSGDQLEETLRRVNGSAARRGVPSLYRGERELGADKADQAEERALQAAHANAQTPAEAADAYEVASLRDLRKQLLLELEAKRREIAALATAIEKERGRLADETARQDKMVAEVIKNRQTLVADSQAHYEARLRSTWKTEADLEEHNSLNLRSFGDQIETAVQAKRQINRIMQGTTVAEWLNGFKETAEGVLNSPGGQAVGLGIAARIGAAVTGVMSAKGATGPDGKPMPPLTKEDVMAAFVLQGRDFKVRQAALRELKASAPGVRAEAAQLGADFVSGLIELRVLAEYLRRGGAP
jgi:hypothetical protein